MAASGEPKVIRSLMPSYLRRSSWLFGVGEVRQPFVGPRLPSKELAPSQRRDAYRDAIEKVRSQHSGSIKHATTTVECPRCGIRQVLTDAPGMRVCLKCGFEFGRTRQG